VITRYLFLSFFTFTSIQSFADNNQPDLTNTNNHYTSLTTNDWFEQNTGQYPEQYKFVYIQNNSAHIIKNNGIELIHKNNKNRVSLEFTGPNTDIALKGSMPLQGKINYLLGNSNYTNIPLYKEVIAKNIYQGIDIRYYETDKGIEFDFIVHPGAKPEQILMNFTQANQLKKNDRGDILIDQQKTLYAPVIYQNNKIIDGEYQIKNNTVSLLLASYDKSKPLIIDPVLSFSTYMGGSMRDEAFEVAKDQLGNIYMAGYTNSADLDTSSAYQTVLGGFSSAFVAKYSPGPNPQLLYLTYVGNDVAEARGLTVDAEGNAYVTGSTSSTTFPTVNPVQASYAGLIDGYIFKLNPTGDTLLYSTYFGGNSVDRGRAIDIDTSGNIYVTGVTISNNFPTIAAFQPTPGGQQDAYVFKLNSSGQNYIYSTYIGGNGGDYAAAIKVDSNGNAYITGNTSSNNYPTLQAAQSINNGMEDAIISVFDNNGNLTYSSYIGGSQNDFGMDIDIGNLNNIFISGSTESLIFPFIPTGSNQLNGIRDGFISRVKPGDNSNTKSLLIGGSGSDSAISISTGFDNEIHIAGVTTSNDLPLINPIQYYNNGLTDIFISTIDINSNNNFFTSYIGGTGYDTLTDMKFYNNHELIFSGYTKSANYPTINATQTTYSGESDSILSSISLDNDNDNIADYKDNCPDDYNPFQEDNNNNNTGDICEPPTISGFWPGNGNSSKFIFLFGSGFQYGTTQVNINDINAPQIQFITQDMLIFLLPEGNTNGLITVTTPYGNTSSTSLFGNNTNGLSISGIWPGAGSVAGRFVFVFGSDFINPLSISIDSMNIPVFQLISENMLIFQMPENATSGIISITTSNGSISSTQNYQVLN